MTKRPSSNRKPAEVLCPSPLISGHARVPMLAGFCVHAVQCPAICPHRPVGDPLYGDIADAVPRNPRKPIDPATLAEAMLGCFDPVRIAIWYAHAGAWDHDTLHAYMANVVLQVGHRLALLSTKPETHQEPKT